MHAALGDHLTVELGDLLEQPTSWSSAGPRGPAVSMFVLSATGAPVALVRGGVCFVTTELLGKERVTRGGS